MDNLSPTSATCYVSGCVSHINMCRWEMIKDPTKRNLKQHLDLVFEVQQKANVSESGLFSLFAWVQVEGCEHSEPNRVIQPPNLFHDDAIVQKRETLVLDIPNFHLFHLHNQIDDLPSSMKTTTWYSTPNNKVIFRIDSDGSTFPFFVLLQYFDSWFVIDSYILRKHTSVGTPKVSGNSGNPNAMAFWISVQDGLNRNSAKWGDAGKVPFRFQRICSAPATLRCCRIDASFYANTNLYQYNIPCIQS